MTSINTLYSCSLPQSACTKAFQIYFCLFFNASEWVYRYIAGSRSRLVIIDKTEQ